MRMELSEVETRELRQLLHEALDELQTETQRTDALELRLRLRARRDRLEGLLRQLELHGTGERAAYFA